MGITKSERKLSLLSLDILDDSDSRVSALQLMSDLTTKEVPIFWGHGSDDEILT